MFWDGFFSLSLKKRGGSLGHWVHLQGTRPLRSACASVKTAGDGSVPANTRLTAVRLASINVTSDCETGEEQNISSHEKPVEWY